MDRKPVVIRDARPTLAEGLACGRYLDTAAEGFFRVMLGPRYDQIIARSFDKPDHSYSYQNVIFAEHDDRVVGMALGFSADQHRGFSDRPIKEAAGSQVFRMMAIKALCAPLIRILNTLEDGTFYILAMAVDEDMRGRGIGSLLMNSCEERARSFGAQRLDLDVSAGNDVARKLYDARGMSVKSQWPKRLRIPGMKLYRMTRKI